MDLKNPFKWHHYSSEIILLCVRWYCRYPLSYRNLEEMMNERGLETDHTTIYRWVQKYGSGIRKRLTACLKSPGDSWRIDETYIKIKGQWSYLYRAVDSKGAILDFYLSKTRDKEAALTFFKSLSQLGDPRVINVDKNAAYPPAFSEMQQKGLFKNTEFRQAKYLNNVLEQDHRTVKRHHKQAMGYQSLETAKNTIAGIEAMHMISKNQIEGLTDLCIQNMKKFIDGLFMVEELAA